MCGVGTTNTIIEQRSEPTIKERLRDILELKQPDLPLTLEHVEAVYNRIDQKIGRYEAERYLTSKMVEVMERQQSDTQFANQQDA